MSSHTSSAVPPALNCSCWKCVDARKKAKRDLIDFAKSGGPVVDGLRAREAAFNADVLALHTKVLPPRELYGEDMWPRTVPRMQEQKSWSAVVAAKDETHPKRGWRPHDAPVKRPESLNVFALSVHHDNAHWWHDPATGAKLDRNMGEMLMLVVSEIAECMEGECKDLMDDHLPHRKMAEVELADAVIRIADIAGAKSYSLEAYMPPRFPRKAPDNKGEELYRISRLVTQTMDSLSERYRSSRLSHAIFGIEQYAKKHGYDLWGAVAEKREYNKHRADHKPAARLAANGKKF